MLGPENKLRYVASFNLRKLVRGTQNFFAAGSFAKSLSPTLLPHLILEHETPIYRNLSGVDPQLFHNKRQNLTIAIEALNKILIPPGKVFSFWNSVGRPSRPRGFQPGLVITRGAPDVGIGGGLCQLSNSLFWLALHSELQIIERHRHSFDLFPDDHRLIPFGTGATVLFNYKDLRFRNPTNRIFQFAFELNNCSLTCRLYCSAPPPVRYEIRETEQQFHQTENGLFRSNKILRVSRGTRNEELSTELLFQNYCKCQYANE